MLPRPFKLERYLARWEFEADHFLSASDCESMTIGELLEVTGSPESDLLGLHLGYTESEGDPELREAIGATCDVDPTGVVVTNAPEEGIFLSVVSLVRPGDRVVVQTPCYQSLFELARYRGGEVESWPMIESETSWEWDLDRLADLLKVRTRLLVINAPHNPTGFQPTRGQLEQVIELCAAHGTWLFFDQMYRGLEPTETDRLPCRTGYSRAISLAGMSKTYGLPGLRIGWLSIEDPGQFESVMGLKDYTTICSSSPGMLLSRVALESSEKLAARNREIIRSNIDRVEGLLERRQDLLSWIPPAAGPVALARLRSGSAADLCSKALEQAGVLLVPSSVFDWGDSHIRLGLGRQSFASGLAAFETWLEGDADSVSG